MLREPLAEPINAARATQLRRIPTVLTRSEVRLVLAALDGTHQLMAQLFGPRLIKCLRM